MDKHQTSESSERWYCVRTKPKKERSAAAVLAARHELEVFCPQVRFRRKTVRGGVWFQEAMFPGYIFVRFDLLEMKRAVVYSNDVLNIPVFNGEHIPVPDRMIAELRNELDAQDSVDAGLPLEVGDSTTIMDGPMRGLQVKVVRLMPAQQRVAVLMELLGTLVETEFDVDALEHQHRNALAAG